MKYSTELWSSVLENLGLEVGIIYLCSGVLSIGILVSVEGDLSRLEGICFKKSKNVQTCSKIFRVLVTLIVLLPLLLLIAWGTYVFY